MSASIWEIQPQLGCTKGQRAPACCCLWEAQGCCWKEAAGQVQESQAFYPKGEASQAEAHPWDGGDRSQRRVCSYSTTEFSIYGRNRPRSYCYPFINEPSAPDLDNMYLQSTFALLNYPWEIAAEKVSTMLQGIDELPKTCKVANELRFLLDIRECKMSTRHDLVVVESFESLI